MNSSKDRLNLTLKLGVGLVSAAALASCGLKGELKRPPPLVGNPPIDGPDDPRLEPKEPEVEQADTFEDDVPDDELLGGLE